MKLRLPEPQIDIGTDGFSPHCKLGRQDMGEKLSGLLSSIDTPIVVALDGPWGSGKSHFLKCWCGAHVHGFGYSEDIVVYFDAFKNDYLSDPLLALTFALEKRFANGNGAPKKIEKLKHAAISAGKPLLRIGLAAATAGVSEASGPIIAAIVGAANEQANSLLDELWKAETGRMAAMENFAKALTELATAEDEQRQFIFIVDELDRCRPDYALSLLEIIKHFFSVPNVHFVLGVNLEELGNSIQSRYGAGVDTNAYLQKFIDVRMRLEPGLDHGPQGSEARTYFNHVADAMALDNAHYKGMIDCYLEIWGESCPLTLRNMEKLVSAAVLTPALPDHPRSRGRYILIAGLLILEIGNPQLLDEIRQGENLPETWLKVAKYFSFSEITENSGSPEIEIVNAWYFFLKRGFLYSQGNDLRWRSELGFGEDTDSLRRELFSRHLDVFQSDHLIDPAQVKT